MQTGFRQRVEAAAESVRMRTASQPAVAVVLGSGLTAVAESVEGEQISYADIAGFPQASVSGHRGVVFVSEQAMMFAGRFHAYEGHSFDSVVLPVCVAHALGVRALIVTNAAGGIREGLNPGTMALIRDHVNLLGDNPLVGPNPQGYGPRFPDMSMAYDAELRAVARSVSPVPLEEGVYAAVLGPNYETPAEVRMLRALGADMVGMSTVPEVIMARYLAMRVVGVSTITNRAAGLGSETLDHAEVLAIGDQMKGELETLLLRLIEYLTDSTVTGRDGGE